MYENDIFDEDEILEENQENEQKEKLISSKAIKVMAGSIGAIGLIAISKMFINKKAKKFIQGVVKEINDKNYEEY